MAENNKCLDIKTVNEIETLYYELKKEEKETLKAVLPHYIENFYKLEDIAKDDDC